MGKVPAWSLGLFLVLAIPTNAADPSQSPGDAAAPGGRVLELRVVERDGGKPVAGVAICSLLGCNDEPSFRGTTDDQGRCSVPVPRDVEATRYFPVHAWRDGFVPVRVVWGSARQFEFEGVPASYTVLLDRGVPIGGVVRDEQGRPVAGARVFPTFTGRRRDEFEWLDLPRDASFATDDQGRWRCAILPASWEAGEMSFRITHPRFLGSGPTYDRRLPIKDLRALSAVAVLETGYTLSGTVIDQAGRPIEGASVVWRDPNDEGGSLRVKSGAGGRFRFENRPPGIGLIAAEVPGLATVVKQVELGPPDTNRRVPMLPEGDRPALILPAGELPPIAPRPLGADGPVDPLSSQEQPPAPPSDPNSSPATPSNPPRTGLASRRWSFVWSRGVRSGGASSTPRGSRSPERALRPSSGGAGTCSAGGPRPAPMADSSGRMRLANSTC